MSFVHQDLLEDKTILKVGVNPVEAAMKLSEYGVRTESIFDIRYLVKMCDLQPAELSVLSVKHLNIKLKDYHRLQHERWQKEKRFLRVENINYAAKVGRVTIELFVKFEEKFRCDKPDATDFQTFIESNLKQNLNKNYRRLKKPDEEIPTKELGEIDVHVISDAEKCRTIVQQLRKYRINDYLKLRSE